MALEQLNYSQVVTFQPQPAAWTQTVVSGGTAAVGVLKFGPFGGLTYFASGTFSAGPIPSAGDRFQLWNTGALKESTVFTVAGTTPGIGNATQLVYTTFNQSTTPTPTSDVNGYTLGMQFTLSTAAALTGIWFYSSPLATILPTAVAIYQVTGPGTGSQVASTLNASPSWSGAAGSGWVKVTYNGSVTLSSGTPYKVCVFSPGASPWYSRTDDYFSSGGGAGGKVSGIISVPNSTNGDSGQDSSNTSFAAIGYPNTFDDSDYGVDVEVTVSTGSAGNWLTFFTPTPQVSPASGDTVISLPAPKNPRWLGSIGHVSGLNRSYTCPGGPDAMTLLLRLPADYRTDATDPGRVVQVWRGASCVWEGKLNEPAPGPDGWTVTAHGAGTYGTDFAATYATWNADDAIDDAISRGLRWNNPGIGTPPGMWLAQQQDTGSETVTAHLNLLITGGGLLWLVTRGNASSPPAGPWTLSVVPFKSDANGNPLTEPDRLLICNSPVARTVGADINTLILRYQATADVAATATKPASAATFATTFVINQGSVAKHGPMEFYLDISSAGVLSNAAAQTVGSNILTRYVRASFAGPFTAGPGQVRNAAGTPVDLGCDEAGLVYQVMVTDAPYGGEVAAAPLLFMSGAYSYDEDTATATITPYQSVRNDLSSLISALYPSNF